MIKITASKYFLGPHSNFFTFREEEFEFKDEQQFINFVEDQLGPFERMSECRFQALNEVENSTGEKQQVFLFVGGLK